MDSIYIGGGTPSVLSEQNIRRLFGIVHRLFSTSHEAEVTIEVNPNDVRPSLVAALRESGVNRISMGIQSFNDNILRFLHRRHNSQEALRAVDTVINGGIDNISIDLIYGLPEQTLSDWNNDLQTAFSLPVSHLSAYSLMFEEGTRLTQMRNEGTICEADEELSLEMFKQLMHKAREHGFLHYEISNFSLPDKQARHNTGYWNGMHYLGLGPGAHSYDGISRQHNIGDLKAYIKHFSNEHADHTDRTSSCGNTEGNETDRTDDLANITGCHNHKTDYYNNIAEEEILTTTQKKEEMLLTSLRTAQGLCLSDFAQQFGQESLYGVLQRAVPFINDGDLMLTRGENASFADSDNPVRQHAGVPNSFLALSSKGIFVSDYIISSLFE